jgi:hypothetical protein
MADDGHTLDLGHGVELRCSMPSLDGTVRVALAFRDHEIFSTALRPDSPPHAVRHAGDHLDLSLELWTDAFRGEVAAGGHLRLRAPFADDWHTLFDADRDVLVRFSPGVGQVGGSSSVHEPLILDERFGRSQLCTPAVLRIFVDEEDRAISQVGRLVKSKLFRDRPPFVFNTVACVGQADPKTFLGLYPDPSSGWFNVFFGYYQLDAPKSQWSRPFGYRSADGIASEIEVEDVMRLGKSDWNFFSNWMYGVPEESIEPYNGIDVAKMPNRVSPPERVGSSVWHRLVIDDVEVASTYESDARGAAQLETHTPLVDVWRYSFGLPNPQRDWGESFIPSTLRAAMWMSYWEDEDAYHTTIFGGTRPKDGPEAFLDAQLAAVRTVMERGYPKLGFAPPER